ncbi:hypothetical protein HanRHA438_Chr00c58g0859501 [Helianthus annuus]|nr:hypothetical protein HanRHA438_Chr00c58g0859501 [Helianthus annuus]
MADLKYAPYHNVCACFENTSKNSLFHHIIDFMMQSSLYVALSVKPQICEKHIRDFWGSARLENDSIHATVDGQNITITQAMISNTFEFDDLDAVKWYSEKRVRICMDMMGYNVESHEKQYQKKVFNPLWRYIAHVILRCMSCRRDNFEELNQRLASMMIAFAYQQEFNYSSYIFYHY